MLLIVFFTTTAISLLLFAVIVYEFLRIHNKRVHMVANMPLSHIRQLRRGTKRMVILYFGALLLYHAYAAFLLFSV
jgi:hypothetical protein